MRPASTRMYRSYTPMSMQFMPISPSPPMGSTRSGGPCPGGGPGNGRLLRASWLEPRCSKPSLWMRGRLLRRPAEHAGARAGGAEQQSAGRQRRRRRHHALAEPHLPRDTAWTDGFVCRCWAAGRACPAASPAGCHGLVAARRPACQSAPLPPSLPLGSRHKLLDGAMGAVHARSEQAATVGACGIALPAALMQA